MFRIICMTLFCLGISGCGNDTNTTHIIPKPNSSEPKSGTLSLTSTINIVFESNTIVVNGVADHLSTFLADYVELDVEKNGLSSEHTQIEFILTNTIENIEAYELEVDESGVKISAASPHGLFNGVQSLKQLFFNADLPREVPHVKIGDQPSFAYRGMMLDVSRHFFKVDEIKRFLDLMALYKMNKFHWHLTDDQGWRIEIKQYPLLTEVGGYRIETMVDKNDDPYIGDGVEHSGYYSQNEIKEVVTYAKALFIDVIPEIEMPGHSLAALAAYPELACEFNDYTVATTWGVHKDVMCPTEDTFTFVENVLTEVMELFPYTYLHIGGDEVPTVRWQQSEIAQNIILEQQLNDEEQLQGYFFDRIDAFLQTYNKQTVGWDEILDKSIKSSPAVMIWRDDAQVSVAVEKELPIILTNRLYTYFDYYQGNHENEPLAQCCMLDVAKVYDMPTSISSAKNANILGGQGQLWTAFIKNESHLQYMALPRMLALSEVLWTEQSNKSWDSFRHSLDSHFSYFDEIKINYKSID
jgi:hexosaminidase